MSWISGTERSLICEEILKCNKVSTRNSYLKTLIFAKISNLYSDISRPTSPPKHFSTDKYVAWKRTILDWQICMPSSQNRKHHSLQFKTLRSSLIKSSEKINRSKMPRRAGKQSQTTLEAHSMATVNRPGVPTKQQWGKIQLILSPIKHRLWNETFDFKLHNLH